MRIKIDDNELKRILAKALEGLNQMTTSFALADILGRVLATLEKAGVVNPEAGLKCIDEFSAAALMAESTKDVVEAFMRALNRAVPVALERE